MRKSPLVLLLAVAAACGGSDDEGAPVMSEASREAARRACISARLAQQTTDELQTLEQMSGTGQLTVFSRALNQHALLREVAYAHQDSAFRFSPTPQDSARHARLSDQYQISLPNPGSVEENVIRDYERKFAIIYNDQDHPCNWEAELEAQERNR